MDHPRSIPLQRPIEAKLWNEEERLIQDWYKSTLIIAKRNNGDYAHQICTNGRKNVGSIKEEEGRGKRSKGKKDDKERKRKKNGEITGKSRGNSLLKASFVPGDFPWHSHWLLHYICMKPYRSSFHSARNPSDLPPFPLYPPRFLAWQTYVRDSHSINKSPIFLWIAETLGT